MLNEMCLNLKTTEINCDKVIPVSVYVITPDGVSEVFTYQNDLDDFP